MEEQGRIGRKDMTGEQKCVSAIASGSVSEIPW